MAQMGAHALGAAGTGYSAAASIRAGLAQKKIGEQNAVTIEDEADYNAKVQEHNAKVADLQARDAISRGQIAESTSRATTSQRVGNLRAGFGAQGLNLDVGSPKDVVQNDAFIGALDSLTVRNNATKEAWGYGVTAADDRAQAGAIIAKGKVDANSARTNGRIAASSGRNAAVATILGDAGATLRRRYGK